MYFVIRNFVTLETLNMRLEQIEFKNDLIPKSCNKIYIIKQDSHRYIYVPYSRTNDWADWAEFFYGHSWVTGGVIG